MTTMFKLLLALPHNYLPCMLTGYEPQTLVDVVFLGLGAILDFPCQVVELGDELGVLVVGVRVAFVDVKEF